MADVKMSEMAADASVAGTEKILVLDGTTSKTMLTSVLSDYVVDQLLAADAATPTTGDKIVAERSGTEKLMTLDEVSSYAVEYVFSNASEADPSLTGDKVLVDRAGTKYWQNIDTIQTYVLSGIQATVLDLSGLSAGTISDADLLLICEGSTGKKETASDVASYVLGKLQATIAAYDACAAAADADKLYLDDNGTAKYLTCSLLATYVEGEVSANICDDVWDDATGAVTPADADVFVLERSGVRKTATGVNLALYVQSELAGAVEQDPAASGDMLLMDRSGTASTLDVDTLADYVDAYIAANASATDPVVGTDDLLVERAGAIEKADIDVVKTYILDGIQATVLDISGLAAATLADANYILIGDGATAKQKTLSDVAAYVHNGIDAWLQALDDADPVVDADYFLLSRSGAAKYINADDLSTYVITEWWDQTAGTAAQAADQMVVYRSGTGYRKLTVDMISEYVEEQVADLYDPDWDTIDTGDYTATPASTSQINMSDTSLMEVGFPVKFTYGGNTYYAVVASVVSNTSITIRGGVLDPGTDLTGLYVAAPSRVVVERILVPGAYLVPWHHPNGDTTKDLLENIAYRFLEWRHGPATLVEMAITQGSVDSTGQPYLNAKIGGAAVFTDNTNKGPQLDGTAGTWTRAAHGVTGDIANDDAIEILCTTPAGGCAGDATDISVELTFVLQ